MRRRTLGSLRVEEEEEELVGVEAKREERRMKTPGITVSKRCDESFLLWISSTVFI